jgi:hypothetical protein
MPADRDAMRATGATRRTWSVRGRLAYALLGLFGVMTDEVGAFYEKCVTRDEQKAKEARPTTRGRPVARQTGRKTAGAGQPIAAVLDRGWRPSPKWMHSARGSTLCHTKSMC